MENRCGNCNKTDNDLGSSHCLHTCPRLCGKVWYCNRTCKKAHWEKHKKICQSREDELRQHEQLTLQGKIVEEPNIWESEKYGEKLKLVLKSISQGHHTTDAERHGER